MTGVANFVWFHIYNVFYRFDSWSWLSNAVYRWHFSCIDISWRLERNIIFCNFVEIPTDYIFPIEDHTMKDNPTHTYHWNPWISIKIRLWENLYSFLESGYKPLAPRNYCIPNTCAISVVRWFHKLTFYSLRRYFQF